MDGPLQWGVPVLNTLVLCGFLLKNSRLRRQIAQLMDALRESNQMRLAASERMSEARKKLMAAEEALKRVQRQNRLLAEKINGTTWPADAPDPTTDQHMAFAEENVSTEQYAAYTQRVRDHVCTQMCVPGPLMKEPPDRSWLGETEHRPETREQYIKRWQQLMRDSHPS